MLGVIALRSEDSASRLTALLLLALVSGCQTHRPVVILAQDIETRKPIAGAEVRIGQSFGCDEVSNSTTGSDGIVRLRTPVKDEPISIEATCKGYLTETTYIPLRTVRVIEPVHHFEHEETRPVSFVIEMYAGPLPTIELLVPAGYRGDVKARVHVVRNAAWPAGKREFRYEVSPAGEVDVTGPELLGRVAPSSFVLKYADGASVTLGAEHSDLGYWWIRQTDAIDYFFIGTKAEYTLKRSADKAEEIVEHQAPSADEGNHRGRRRGR